MPKVSVIIPLYNKERHIYRAINSVLNQKIQDFEVIVVDDGSTDKGAEIVQQFKDPRIILLQQENFGVSAARNRGVKESRSDFIVFLDADDEWLPDHLEIITQLQTKYPNAGLSSSSYLFVFKGIIQVPKYYYIPKNSIDCIIPNFFKTALKGDFPVCSSTVGIRKKIFYELNGFIEKELIGEDINFWAKIAIRYPVAFSWKQGAYYHLDSDNRACKKKHEIIDDSFIDFFVNESKSQNFEKKLLKDVNKYILKLRFNKVYLNLCSGNQKEARSILSNCKSFDFILEYFFLTFFAYVPICLFKYYNYLKTHIVLKIKSQMIYLILSTA